MATATTQTRAVRAAYRKWAREYDELPNPVTSLDARVVAALLPNLLDLEAADLGCGTGRSFSLLANRGSRFITGVDLSSEMLAIAKERAGRSTRLLEADVCELPISTGAVDFALASLLVGYVTDIRRLAAEMKRILRDGGTILLTDLHPDSIRKFQWKRAAHPSTGSVDLPARIVEIEEIIRTFESEGFVTELKLEFPFGEAERLIFATAGRVSDFERFSHDPALFALQFRSVQATAVANEISIQNATIVIDAEMTTSADLQLGDGHVRSLGLSASAQYEIDLAGMTLFPGLINAHDHLEFALFPRLGNRLYSSASDWALSIHENFSQAIERSRTLDRSVRCTWGALRNALAGVTSVSHHNTIYEGLGAQDFPVRVANNFSWAHSLAFDDAVQQRHRECPSGAPFILHAGEGIDDSARREFESLLDSGVLDHRTVIVHGLAFDEDQFAALAQSGCSLVWCPSSNYFLFGAAHDHSLIEKFPRIALGSDSPLTAEGDLLDEIRFARQVVGVSAQALFRQVTTGAADVLRLHKGEGAIRPSAFADFFAVAGSSASPAERLASLSFRDIELVVNGGKVHVASTAALDRLTPQLREGLAPLEIDGTVRWVRQSLGKLFSDTESALGSDFTLMRRKVRHVPSAWI